MKTNHTKNRYPLEILITKNDENPIEINLVPRCTDSPS